ncbi:MAG: CHAD domain-containing protein [Sulfurimonas sp.]|jgi:CHAD domain-containing protein
MKHSSLTKYLLYHIISATLSFRKINAEDKGKSLHQFRTSLRLVRSLLQLYNMESTFFPIPLKTFLKRTNFLRDLDVLILSLHQKSSQNIAKKLISLRNSQYETLFTEESNIQILAAFDELYDATSKLNPTFVDDYLIQTAYAYYEESLREYTLLTQSTSPKELHKLRIRFKISRYAFDFLHDNGLSDSYEKIKESKGLQDKLGKIHDLHNQIKLLKTLQKQNPLNALKKLLVERKKLLKNSKLPLNLFNPPLS